MTMKRSLTLLLFVIGFCTPACNLVLPGQLAATPSPQILADTFFSGYAFIDSNQNGEIDPEDPPLPGALFLLEGFGGKTDSSGMAFITIPGGWDQPVSARMQAPEGSDYVLISPGEVTLQSGVQHKAEFLFARPNPEVNAPTHSPQPGSTLEDLTYCTTEDGLELKLDISYPRAFEAPAPVILYIHGGGWTSGDKNSGVGRIFIPKLLENGYIVAAVNYRLAPEHRFPAQIEDVKCAVRHLRAEAESYQLDPQRIGALGGSAGGHLVALLGMTDENAGWDVGAHQEQSSRVQAVVDLYGPADLTQLQLNSQRSLGEKVFGVTSPDDPLLENYSPVNYVTPDDPPFLILQGTEDQLVPPSQSEALYERLIQSGVPVELVLVENAGHGFVPKGKIKPSRLELIRLVIDFFNMHLK